MIRFICIFFCSTFLVLESCKDSSSPDIQHGVLQLSVVRLGTQTLGLNDATQNINGAIDQPIVASFSAPLSETSVQQSVRLLDGSDTVKISISFLDSDKTFSAKPEKNLSFGHSYTLLLKKSLRGVDGSTFAGISVKFTTANAIVKILSLTSNAQDILNATSNVTNIPRTFVALATFSTPIDPSTISSDAITLSNSKGVAAITTTLTDNNTVITIKSVQPLSELTKYALNFSGNIQDESKQHLDPIIKSFYTEPDPTPDFPIVSDDELLDIVQRQTLKYFYDFGHPASGMARERNSSGDIVTSGGSGFGIMALVVGIDREFIPRADGVQRMAKIVTFLEKADRFHGAWSHWIDGNTGKVIPFSTKDNGGDLVETSFLVQGLLTFRQYLKPADTVGNNLIRRITKLWEDVEWDWYRKNNEQVLYWHWSPTYDWQMNFPLYGYFEEQITYVLAAASPTHGISKSVYTNGYGKNGAIIKNNTFYGYELPLEGLAPLFWVQYSYLGLDPHFSDDYADYWKQNVNASLIDYAYCVANPKKYVGYGENCWGLTASDEQNGYNAHSPANDNGVITPTAALSSFPYTPVESMKALKFFYYTLGDKLWSNYGFYDAFNLNTGWVANSTLAIDQGPIIVMIENHRTGLLWNLFMSAPEMETAKTTLDLKY